MNLIRLFNTHKLPYRQFGRTLKIEAETVFAYYYTLIKEKHKEEFEKSQIKFEENHFEKMIGL